MRVRSNAIIAITVSAVVALSTAAVLAQSTAKPATSTPAQTQPAPAKPAATAPATQKPATAKPATAKPATAKPAAPSALLRTPAKLKDVAPATYRANFETSVGVFVVEVTKAWAPKGADRFYNLVKYGFFDGNRFFRVVKNFMVQFGINGDPKLNDAWRQTDITDDPVTQSNRKGYITFATRGPNSRTTQVFINFKDNAFLDAQGFAPFGQVVSGQDVVDKLNGEYGEQPSQMQPQIQSGGNAFLAKSFPRLDYIKKATIEKPAAPPPPAKPPVKK
jgi:peptidyl-prolyl cis-trans isomerase A (cyclophilin A)